MARDSNVNTYVLMWSLRQQCVFFQYFYLFHAIYFTCLFFISQTYLTCSSQGNSHYSDYLGNKPNCNLQFHPITNCDVAVILGNLKPETSTGIDTISSKLLRQTKDSITESLTIIVNQMLKTGTFPELLKISKVIPVLHIV